MRIALPLFLLTLGLVACDGGEDGTDSGAATDSGGTDEGQDLDDTDGEDTNDADPLEFIGFYTTDFGGALTVEAEAMLDEGGTGDAAYSNTFLVGSYSNEDNWVVAQNASSNAFNPDQWSRFDWTTDTDGKLWYCQSLFDGESEDAAIAATAADPSDPANGGCGTFGWTGLTRVN